MYSWSASFQGNRIPVGRFLLGWSTSATWPGRLRTYISAFPLNIFATVNIEVCMCKASFSCSVIFFPHSNAFINHLFFMLQFTFTCSLWSWDLSTDDAFLPPSLLVSAFSLNEYSHLTGLLISWTSSMCYLISYSWICVVRVLCDLLQCTSLNRWIAIFQVRERKCMEKRQQQQVGPSKLLKTSRRRFGRSTATIPVVFNLLKAL